MVSAQKLFLLLAVIAMAPLHSQAQSSIAGISSVPGYEQELARKVRETLASFQPKTDNLGNVIVTLGAGFPHRLIVTALDEPGYIVSSITPAGFLRVQRLPQSPPNSVFDRLQFAQPVRITTRTGKVVPGVFAGLSVHLQPRRLNPPDMSHLDEMYVDIGASNDAEVYAAGVNVLDPLTTTLENENQQDSSRRFGIFALTKLLLQLQRHELNGTLTVAFAVQHWLGGRGMNRLLTQLHPDEMIFVGHINPKPPQSGQSLIAAVPGTGLLIGAPVISGAENGHFVEELKTVAERAKLPVTVVEASPPAITDYVKGADYPKRFAWLAVPVLLPVTPAESVGHRDLENLAQLLWSYATKEFTMPVKSGGDQLVPGEKMFSRNVATQTGDITPLAALVETFGASRHENAVREKIKELLPAWAREKTSTDDAGNLILHVGDAHPSPKSRKIVIVAHMDEIGYEVKSIEPDGRLKVDVLGGGYTQYFLGHPVLVHTSNSRINGVLELPDGWDQPQFVWPHGPNTMDDPAHVYVGTRSAEETQKLAIKPGDWITIPKQYRPLLGTRANGRSFDDRVGCAALIDAVKSLGPQLPGRDITFIWSTREEIGLEGAATAAEQISKEGRAPDFVFAIDTFVSSDSPLETDRFAGASLGKGFVVRAVDNSNVVPREYLDRVLKLAKEHNIPAQSGVTGGGNDGSVFLRYGAVDIPLGWPLRYSHSPAEVIDTKDLTALAQIIAVIAREW